MGERISGRMDEWRDGWMDEWMNGWMNDWMDGWMDGWMKDEGRVYWKHHHSLPLRLRQRQLLTGLPLRYHKVLIIS